MHLPLRSFSRIIRLSYISFPTPFPFITVIHFFLHDFIYSSVGPLGGGVERLREVGADVVYVLDADADSDHVLRHPAAVLLSLHDVVYSRAELTKF